MGNRRTVKFFLVFIIILVWVFTGNPKLWPIGNKQNQEDRIPPKINEAEALTVTGGDGLIFYGVLQRAATDWRTYTGGATNAFSASSTLVTGSGGKLHVVKTSPTKQEAIAVFGTSTALQAFCYDGTTWSSEWTTSTVSSATVKGFDVAYEASSGDVMVLYSSNLTVNELAYRTKSGTTGCGSANWSAETLLNPGRTRKIVNWVKLASDRRTTATLIAAVWADGDSDVSSMIWSGTAWGNEPSTALELNLEKVSAINTYPDVDDFDLEYESSGDLMIVWANASGGDGTNGAYYATCTGGTSACTWSATSTIASLLDDAQHLDLSANPATDEMIFASIGGGGSDLQAAYWSGSAWTGSPNLDTSASPTLTGAKLVATGWLVSGATRRSVIVYNDLNATSVNWYAGAGSTFTLQDDFFPSTAFGDPQKWYEIRVDPVNGDNLMLTLSDSNNDLYAKRLTMDSTPFFTWTDSDSNSLETNLTSVLQGPFSFAYWAFIPSVSCSSDISSTDFGGLTTDAVSVSTSNASTTMTCSGNNGCTLYVSDSGSGSNPGLWNSTSSALIESPNAAFSASATLAAGTEGYGIQATTTTVGSGATLGIAARYDQTGNTVGGFSTLNLTLASSTAAVTNRETIVTHKAAISTETPGGTYADTITYSCVLN